MPAPQFWIAVLGQTADRPTTAPELGVALIIGLFALTAITVAVARWGRLGTARESVVAVGRAVVQLAVVATVIATVMQRWWAALLFAAMMLTVAVWTAGGRIDARRCWPWITVVIASSSMSVLAVIYGTGASPFTAPAIISVSGIVIGNTMKVVGLSGQRLFEAIADEIGQVEAALALGFQRPDAINLVIGRRAADALTPALDQTSTVGLVTLPGAFVGVLLGGGSAAQAAASQLLVLVGILAAQTIAVTEMRYLIARGRVLPASLRTRLPTV